MEYQQHDEQAYNIHLFKTDKFKTITVMITFKRKILKEEITKRSFINQLLLLSSKNFPSERLLCKEMERLYGPIIGANERRVGNYAITTFYIQMIDEQYTEPGMNEKSLNFFKEILFNPDVSGGAFNKKVFNIVKRDIRARLRSVKDNLRSYSTIRMLEHLDKDSPLSYRSGYLEDLEHINEKNLYEYYKSMLNSDLVDVFVMGNIDFHDMRKSVNEMIPINTIKKHKKSLFIDHKTANKHINKASEEIEGLSQSKLVIGCKIVGLNDFERKYVLPIYSDILGGPSYSKLFQSVREKNSLAYYIYSNYRRGDNLLIVSSGINKESYDLAVKLIKEQFDNMSKGIIDDDELNRAKEDIISIIKSVEDKPLRLISDLASQTIFDLDDTEKRKKEILNVTIEDVKSISKKIKIDTIYLLHGGDAVERDNN